MERESQSLEPSTERSVVGRLRQGLAALYRGEEEQALEVFLEIARSNPENLRAHYLAALAAALLSDEEALEFVCERARASRCRHPYQLGCEGCRYIFLANFSRSEEMFKAALRALPGDVDLHIGLATLYSLAGEGEQSIQVYKRVLELEPDNVRALVELGMAHAAEGEYANAFVEYQRAKQLDPNVENPHQRLGRDYRSAGLWEEAASEFAVATSEEPEQPTAWFYLLDAYKRLGRFDDALDIYATIQTRFQGRPDLTAWLYGFFHMLPEAIAGLEELARRDPEDAEVRYRLSQTYLQADRCEDAVRVAEEAVRLEPDEPELLVWLAKLYYSSGRYEDAIVLCDRAIAQSETEQMAYEIKSDALLFLGRGKESQQVYEEMERVRDRAWEDYQTKFAGLERPENFN